MGRSGINCTPVDAFDRLVADVVRTAHEWRGSFGPRGSHCDCSVCAKRRRAFERATRRMLEYQPHTGRALRKESR